MRATTAYSGLEGSTSQPCASRTPACSKSLSSPPASPAGRNDVEPVNSGFRSIPSVYARSPASVNAKREEDGDRGALTPSRGHDGERRGDVDVGT